MKRLTQIFSPLTRTSCIIATALVLQGCAISKLTDGLGSSLWGSSKKREVTNSAPKPVSEDVLLAAAKQDVEGDGTGFPGAGTNCPQFVVWPSDRRLTKYADGKQGDSLAVIYRGEITKNARECNISPGSVSIKYGVAGRVLLGPQGQSGSVDLPIVIHVTDRNRNKISSQRFTVPVSVSRENPIGYFSIVRNIAFDIQPGVRPLDYKVFVAFERNAS